MRQNQALEEQRQKSQTCRDWLHLLQWKDVLVTMANSIGNSFGQESARWLRKAFDDNKYQEQKPSLLVREIYLSFIFCFLRTKKLPNYENSCVLNITETNINNENYMNHESLTCVSDPVGAVLSRLAMLMARLRALQNESNKGSQAAGDVKGYGTIRPY